MMDNKSDNQDVTLLDKGITISDNQDIISLGTGNILNRAPIQRKKIKETIGQKIYQHWINLKNHIGILFY